MKTNIAAGIALCTLLLAVLAGCGGEKTTPPVPVGAMQEYRDPGYGFKIKFPQGWVQNTEVGKARFYNAPGVEGKFLEPTGDSPNGVEIAVTLTATATPDSEKTRLVEEMKRINMVVGKEEPVTIDGKNGVRVPYTARYSSDVQETGQHIYISADTLLYDIQTAGFADLFQAYKAVFDASVQSFQFPKPVPKGRDVTLPSENLTEYDSKLFTFEYPDNYTFESIPKRENELAISLRGVNKSCSIQFIVFGAKNLSLEQVFDQNKGSFRGAVSGKATIGGQPAMTLTYSPARDVERRFYFIVRNNKVYRITMDWYKPQRAEYLAAYDKVLSSFKFR
jgi:hypothetical protein